MTVAKRQLNFGNVESAVKSLHKAQKIHPASEEARLLLLTLFVKEKKWNEFLKELNKKRDKISNKNLDAIYYNDPLVVALALNETGQYEKSIITLLDAFDEKMNKRKENKFFSENEHFAYHLIGLNHYQLGNTKDAKLFLKKSLDIKDTADSHNVLADIFFQESQYEISLAQYNAGLIPGKHNIKNTYRIGICNVELRNFKVAFQAFEKIIWQHPEMRQVYRYLGKIKRENAYSEEIEEAVTFQLETLENNFEKYSIYSTYYYYSGDLQNSLTYLEKSANYEPEFAYQLLSNYELAIIHNYSKTDLIGKHTNSRVVDDETAECTKQMLDLFRFVAYDNIDYKKGVSNWNNRCENIGIRAWDFGDIEYWVFHSDFNKDKKNKLESLMQYFK